MSPRRRAPERSVDLRVARWHDGTFAVDRDRVAIEEPMEIRILAQSQGTLARHSISITMRTPGHDEELAAGFLLSEGVVADRGAIASIAHCGDAGAKERRNVVNVILSPDTPFDPSRFTRNVYTTSSCGVCGKTSLDLVSLSVPDLGAPSFALEASRLARLPDALVAEQAGFTETGGLHATGLFDPDGELRVVREDVGRHNAMDKLIGRLFLDGDIPHGNGIVMVSGRASYELVQKALAAGIPFLAAVGAPSSLACDMARRAGMTLVGFVRGGRFNVYSGEERVGSLGSATRR